MLRIRITICAILLWAGAAHAAIDNAGTTAGNFLSVGTGAGILSMGGATLGDGHDLNAAAWNPALLGRLAGSQFALSHAALAPQSSQEWLATGGRLGAARTRWAASALYQGDGTFDGRDATGASTGSFNVSSMALGLQLAQPLGEAFVAGLGAHWLNDNLGDASGHGLGFDAGVQGSVGAFGVGAAARNVGGSMQYAAGRFDLPAVYGIGASWTHAASGVRLAVDANFPHAYYNDVRVGGEWRWQDRIALRMGYRMELGAAAGEPLGGPSFGFGAGVDGMWMDYAFLASGAQAQGQHRLGLTFRPGFLNRALHPVASDNAPAPMGPVAVSQAPATKSAPAAQSATAAPAAVAAPPPAQVTPAPIAAPPMAQAAPSPAAQSPPHVDTAAPVADAMTELPPAGALRSEVAPRAPSKAAPASVRPSRAVRVAPIVMPTQAELARLAAAAAPAPATPAPQAAANAGPNAGSPAAATPPAAAPSANPFASAPAAPTAPAAAPEPAPIAHVASSAPRVVVVTHPSTPEVAASHAPVSRPASVTVRKGETMADIARRWHTSTAAIMMVNDLVREDVSQGQKLKLPR